jgi:hypothetical protein
MKVGMRGLNILDFNKNWSMLSTGRPNVSLTMKRKLISGDNWRNDKHLAMVEKPERHSINVKTEFDTFHAFCDKMQTLP